MNEKVEFKEGSEVEEPIILKVSESNAKVLKDFLKKKADNTGWVLKNKSPNNDKLLKRRLKVERKIVDDIKREFRKKEVKEEDES